jgi:hypothetical protein
MGTRVVSVGRFPVCPQNATSSQVGQGTLYPFGFTESEMLKLYWINKYNSIYFDGSGSNANNFTLGGIEYSVSISYRSQIITTTDYTITSEKDFIAMDHICYPSVGFHYEIYGGDSNPIDPEEDFHNAVSYDISGTFNFSSLLKYNNLYYPYIDLTFFIYSRAGVNAPDDFLFYDYVEFRSFATYPPSGYYPPTSPEGENGYSLVLDKQLIVNLFGKSFVLNGVRNTAADYYGNPIFYSTITYSNVSLSALSYWPYAAKDGTAIYDTLTGAQLQSPFA